eukprot:CAMPEP_0198333380 /NCGR_PEP_ID=MMETSP1450-20131203/18922_1 /TAXON_ID=753684 ORGANISM="Madagascaria erythrocladiodes, Strain CCMP3234" /NCGR_SAMPLE_ID=MMETSP1450 /ASSEMBLY_ACC=CAM_ASM_001115 /LENGTH=340 /DNA_ID=CAMNT_0044037891 /DNA_START=76 /DNA_END=1098 /DNA_ORIENTATION=+
MEPPVEVATLPEQPSPEPHSHRAKPKPCGRPRPDSQSDNFNGGEQVDRNWKDLVELCESKGHSGLYSMYRPAHVVALLRRYSPQNMFRCMVRAQAHWCEYFPRPSSMRPALQRFLQSGAFFVRGCDQGRRPILWIKDTILSRAWNRDSQAYCAYMIWQTFAAMVQRPLDVPFITLVLDESARRPIDHNLEAVRLFLEFFRKLGPPFFATYKVYLVSPKIGSKILVTALGKLFPEAFAERLVLVENRKAVFDICANPRDVPEYYGSPGTPISISSSSIGDFDDLFFKDGRVSIEDVLNGPELPSAESPLGGPELRESHQTSIISGSSSSTAWASADCEELL